MKMIHLLMAKQVIVSGRGGRGLLAYRPTFSDWAVLHRCFAALARSEKRNKLPECIRFDLLMRAFFLFFLSFQLINLREVSEQRRCFGSSATNIQSNEACKLQTSHFRSRLTGCRSQKRLLNHSESQTFMTLALSRGKSQLYLTPLATSPSLRPAVFLMARLSSLKVKHLFFFPSF